MKNYKNKLRSKDNHYIVIKVKRTFDSLNKAILELNRVGKGFRVAKLVKGIARICSKCKISMGKNNFKFCPNCGTEQTI